MMFEVLITPAVKQRIREQAVWIATEQAGLQVAAEWLTRIEETITGDIGARQVGSRQTN